MSQTRRVLRRHHVERMKARAEMVGRLADIPGNWRKLYNHLAACSCMACGNQRRIEGPTMQERRAMAETENGL